MTYDAIVVGAGHNGLVAAIYLAKAGRRTLVLERNPYVGGAMRSAELTRPGFVHDVYSTNMNLFLASPVMREMGNELERHGLRFRFSSNAYASVFPGGRSLRVYQDVDRTLDGLAEHHPGDARRFAELFEEYKAFRDNLLPVYGTPLPSAAAAGVLARAVRRLGRRRVLELAQLVLSSTRAVSDSWFETDELKALVSAWGMHLDFGPDITGGGLYLLLTSFSDMEHGMAVCEGGASAVPRALVGVLDDLGGEVRTQAEVSRVVTSDGRVTGVELSSGERLGAHTVVANLSPTVLYERLLSAAPLAPRFRQRVGRYRYAPGCMMVHLALERPPAWQADPELSRFVTIHVGPYLEDLARTYHEAVGGLLPTSPMLIASQTSAADPTRAPDGQAVLYVQVRNVPSTIRADAAGEIAARDWDAVKEPMADRIVAKLEQYAPGLSETIIDRAVLSPLDLERDNPNLVGGDSEAGSHHLFQNLMFRPVAGWSRYRTPIDGLYMVGAGTWPGGGNNALSGYLGAQEILRGGASRHGRRSIAAVRSRLAQRRDGRPGASARGRAEVK